MNLITKANKFFRKGELDEAIAFYNQSIQLAPNFSWSYYGLGQALASQGKYDEAAIAYRRAIGINPTCAWFYYELGKLLEQQDNLPSAIAFYKRATQINQSLYQFYQSLGKAFTKINLLSEALEAYDRAVQLNSCSVSIREEMGEIAQKQSKLSTDLISQVQKLEQLPDKKIGWPEKHYIVNYDYRLIYCPIPKNACTSVTKFMVMLSNLQEKEKILELPGGKFHPYVRSKLTLRDNNYRSVVEILDNSDYFKFTVVRNPWERLLSAYLNKFVQYNDPRITKKVIDDVYYNNNENPDYNKSINFQQFIEYLVRTKDENLNDHFRPQYLFLGNTKFDFIAQFETLEKDFEFIKKKFNITFNLSINNVTNYSDAELTLPKPDGFSSYYPSELNKLGSYPYYTKFYNKSLIELVKKRYQKDIDLFSYTFKIN